MNPKLKAALEKLQAGLDEQKGLLATEAPSDVQKARIAELDGELDALETECKDLKADADREAKAAERNGWLNTAVTSLPVGDGKEDTSAVSGAETKDEAIRAIRRARGGIFKADQGRTAQQKAYEFGQWLLGGVLKHEPALRYCKEHGIELKAQSESVLTGGGAIVPPDFEYDLIDLREQFGVARSIARVVRMTSNTREVPRRTGGVTAYAIGEGDQITESDKTWDLVELVARKWGCLTYISSELSEDAVIDVGNDLAAEMAYAFAVKEDDCLINGDGTSTYHGITGLCPKLKGLTATYAYTAGLIVGTGNAYSELTLTDFEAVVGRLPQYADTPNTYWVCHRSFYWNVMIKLMLAAGGVTEAEVSQSGRNIPFLGYPVRISQKMPSVEANSQVCALFGDFSKGVLFGDRRMTTVAVSEHDRFEYDQVAIRATERFDINFHDPGNFNATAALRVPGPVIGLLTAAS